MSDLHPEFRKMLGLDKPDRAPTIVIPLARHQPGDGTRYGNAALNGECNRVATAANGTRNRDRNHPGQCVQRRHHQTPPHSAAR